MALEKSKVEEILSGLNYSDDGIYGYDFESSGQEDEVEFRDKVAHQYVYDNYLEELSRHHSIPVMDREVELFLDNIPVGGIILDVGGCWGWHWRNIKKQRPDIIVVILDLVRNNLNHAKRLLGELVGDCIYLVHGNALALKFKDGIFDGYWSVQTLQHIPNYELAIEESYRVLKKGGFFANYTLNRVYFIELIYKLLGKNYEGIVWGGIYLRRASCQEERIIERVYDRRVKKRYTEILFHPDIRVRLSGRYNFWGALDRRLSGESRLLSKFARQCSYHVRK